MSRRLTVLSSLETEFAEKVADRLWTRRDFISTLRGVKSDIVALVTGESGETFESLYKEVSNLHSRIEE